jgi:hypothetical protein
MLLQRSIGKPKSKINPRVLRKVLVSVLFFRRDVPKCQLLFFGEFNQKIQAECQCSSLPQPSGSGHGSLSEPAVEPDHA